MLAKCITHTQKKKALKTIDLNLLLQHYTDALCLWLSPKNTTAKGVLVRRQDSLVRKQESREVTQAVSLKVLSKALISDRFQAFNSISPRKLWCGLGFLFVLCVGFFCLVFFCCCWLGVLGFFKTRLSFCQAFKFSTIRISSSGGKQDLWKYIVLFYGMDEVWDDIKRF